MGRFIRRYKALSIALALSVAPPAFAAVPDLEPLNYAVRYDVYWNSIPLGRLRINTHEDKFGYSLDVDTKTRGLANLFDKQTSTVKTRGRMADGEYMPIDYHSTSTDGDGSRVTVLKYDEEGTLKSRSRTPDDDPDWRKPVPEEQADTATDPITAFFRIRRAMHDNIARNVPVTIQRTYEGARLAEFEFKVVSRARTEAMENYTDTINIVPRRTPIAGYTPKEQKRFKEKGDPTVHMYFSADGKFIPVAIDVGLPFGTLTAKLTEITKTK